MSVRLRYALPTVLLAGAVLISGCAGSGDDPKAGGQPTSRAPGARPSPSAALPDGIVKPGTALPVGDGAWTVTLQGFKRLPAGSVPVPAGSSAYTARVTVANQRAQVATAPRTAVTARYGALGRTADEATDSSASSSEDGAQQVRPNGSIERDLKLVFPDRAQGLPVTVTVEATEEGLAEPELLFFEGALPGGAAASPEPQEPQGAPSRQSATPLGQWNDRVRLGKVTVTGEGASRTASLELSVVNRSGDPVPGLGTTLRILTGQDLHLAATVRPVYGYHDAAIAPHRTATQTVSFHVPEAAVGGPVTVEAVDAGGSKVTFEGTLG
ncbi:hypothetical protein ABT072_47990 [Streptomyces sp. NPDC002589]|uniref:hypothetical protein n=1 Tax=Streptomyces sp. NPDC002589 TaxID=3154420 RepID=UPI00332AB9C5